MATGQTTQLKPITGAKPPEVVILYAPDGSPHKCSPVDAREILAANLGYTTEPPTPPESSAPIPMPGDGMIPDDFPGALSLREAGYLSLAQLDGKTAEELVKLKGIGPATAKAIVDAYAKLSFTEN